MLTILSWLIFIPAVVWNILFFSIAFNDITDKKSYQFRGDNGRSNLLAAAWSLLAMIVPGVYLFGVW